MFRRPFEYDAWYCRGKKSGLASIRLKCQELGLEIAEDRYPALLAATKELAAHQRSLVSDEDFRKLVERMPALVRDRL